MVGLGRGEEKACSVTMATPAAAGGKPSWHGGACPPPPRSQHCHRPWSSPGAAGDCGPETPVIRCRLLFGDGNADGGGGRCGVGGPRGKGRGLRNQSRDLQALARAIQKGFLKEGSVSQTLSGKVAPHLFHDLFSICLPTDSCLLKSVYLKTESLLPSWKWRAACTCHK